MEKISEIQIKCLNKECGKWFPSPIFFGDMKSLLSSTMFENKVTCHHCKKWTACNKEHMKFI